MRINFKKIKLKDRTPFIEFEEITTTGDGSTVVNDCTTQYRELCHEDFLLAFASLAPHLAIIAETNLSDAAEHKFTRERLELENDEIDQKLIGNLEQIIVTGVAFGGSDESEGVVIIGQRKLKSGKVLNITSPFIKLDGEDYDYTPELIGCLGSVEKEMYEYMAGKVAMKQMEIPFPDMDAAEVRVEDPEKPKRGRKPKMAVLTESTSEPDLEQTGTF